MQSKALIGVVGAVAIVIVAVVVFLGGGSSANPILTCVEGKGGAARGFEAYIVDFAQCSGDANEAHPHLETAAFLVEALQAGGLYDHLGQFVGGPSWVIAKQNDDISHEEVARRRLAEDILPHLPGPGIRATVADKDSEPAADGSRRYLVQFYITEHYEAANRTLLFTVMPAADGGWSIAKVSATNSL